MSEVCLQYGSQGHVISRKSKAKHIFIIWLLQPRGAYPLPKNVKVFEIKTNVFLFICIQNKCDGFILHYLTCECLDFHY